MQDWNLSGTELLPPSRVADYILEIVWVTIDSHPPTHFVNQGTIDENFSAFLCNSSLPRSPYSTFTEWGFSETVSLPPTTSVPISPFKILKTDGL